MREIELKSGKYLLVEVPEAHKYYILESCNNKGQGLFWQDGTPHPSWEVLPPGQWSIVGKASELDIGSWENEDVVKNIPAYQQSTTLILKAI